MFLEGMFLIQEANHNQYVTNHKCFSAEMGPCLELYIRPQREQDGKKMGVVRPEEQITELYLILEDNVFHEVDNIDYGKYVIHESENESDRCSVVSDSLRPHGLYSPWNSPGQNTGVGSLSLSPGDLPNPGIEPRFPALQADSLPVELQGKPKNTAVGILSLFQGIFPTHDLNWGLLHCTQMLY